MLTVARSKLRSSKMTVIDVHAPTNVSERNKRWIVRRSPKFIHEQIQIQSAFSWDWKARSELSNESTSHNLRWLKRGRGCDNGYRLVEHDVNGLVVYNLRLQLVKMRLHLDVTSMPHDPTSHAGWFISRSASRSLTKSSLGPPGWGLIWPCSSSGKNEWKYSLSEWASTQVLPAA